MKKVDIYDLTYKDIPLLVAANIAVMKKNLEIKNLANSAIIPTLCEMDEERLEVIKNLDFTKFKENTDALSALKSMEIERMRILIAKPFMITTDVEFFHTILNSGDLTDDDISKFVEKNKTAEDLEKDLVDFEKLDTAMRIEAIKNFIK